MKRFMLFAGENYYPCGGMEDFKGSFDTYEEAEEYVNTKNKGVQMDGWGWDWAHVYDTETQKVKDIK